MPTVYRGFAVCVCAPIVALSQLCGAFTVAETQFPEILLTRLL
jgi:hypothetical protein